MYLIIGLGNPGHEYQNTRHNLGFKTLDSLSCDWEKKFDSLSCKTEIQGKEVLIPVNESTLQKKFDSLTCRTQIQDKEAILAKPQTFMNLSGKAVVGLTNFYKTEELIVIHDEMDIPLGTIKISKNKNSGGHKGVQSIIDSIGSKEFVRIRIGIGRPNKAVSQFVLEDFDEKDYELAQESIKKASEAIKEIISNGYEIAASKYN